MLLQLLLAGLTSRTFDEIKENDPEQYDTLIQSFVTLLEAATKLLHHSPELRRAFAQVHTEFMQHPEMATTVEAARFAITKLVEAED